MCRGGWIIVGCCSGYECGCMGGAVGIRPCKKCNPKGDKAPPKELEHLEVLD